MGGWVGVLAGLQASALAAGSVGAGPTCTQRVAAQGRPAASTPWPARGARGVRSAGAARPGQLTGAVHGVAALDPQRDAARVLGAAELGILYSAALEDLAGVLEQRALGQPGPAGGGAEYRESGTGRAAATGRGRRLRCAAARPRLPASPADGGALLGCGAHVAPRHIVGAPPCGNATAGADGAAVSVDLRGVRAAGTGTWCPGRRCGWAGGARQGWWRAAEARALGGLPAQRQRGPGAGKQPAHSSWWG